MAAVEKNMLNPIVKLLLGMLSLLLNYGQIGLLREDKVNREDKHNLYLKTVLQI
jgi:hypothetical protein